MSRIRQTARPCPADEPFFLIRSAAGGAAHGGGIAPHAHPWHQMIFARSGVLSVRTDRGAWAVPPGSAVWAAASTEHSISFHGACSYVALYVRRRVRRRLPTVSSVIVVSELLRALILKTAELGMLDRRQREHRAIAELIYAELEDRTEPMLSLSLPTSARLRQVAEQVLNNVTAQDIDALTRHRGLSRRTLERGFAKETGQSFGRWRRHARFLATIQLLGQGSSVAEAARSAGYRSSSAFIAAFSTVFETTPGRMFTRDINETMRD